MIARHQQRNSPAPRSSLGSPPFGLTPVQGAVVGIVVCTGLAFALTSLAEKAIGTSAPPSPGLRRNGTRYRETGNRPLPPPYGRVVVIADKGHYFGQVLDTRTDRVLFETMRERSPFAAKQEADAYHRRLEKMGAEAYPIMLAMWEEEQAGRARVTDTGRRIALVTAAAKPAKRARKPRSPRRPRSA